MKKVFFFLAAAAFTFASCSDDDSNDVTTPVVDQAYLTGDWLEVSTDSVKYTFEFEGSNATLGRTDGLSAAGTYTVSGNKLLITGANATTPSQHVVQKVDSITMKVGNIYLAGPAENGTPATVTFKKVQLLD